MCFDFPKSLMKIIFLFFNMIDLSRFSFLLLFISFGYTASLAQGDLMIYPKRLVFEGNQSSQDLTLANTGNDSAQYQLTFVNYRMNEDGKFEKINEPEPGQRFAENNLRLFPRTVTLAPNEAQKVKVQVFRANQLEEGEYRSHLYFRAVPKQKPLEKPTSNENATGITTKLEMVFGISIPVIIEVGSATVNAALTNFSLEQQAENPAIHFTIQREGSKSVYGDFKVTHISPSGKATEVGVVKGVAVYAPIPQRNFLIRLGEPKGVDYSSGKLIVAYHSQEAKKIQLAVGELILN